MRRNLDWVAPFFCWPSSWTLPSCGGCRAGLRQPNNKCDHKRVSEIKTVLVGLNPGMEEARQGRYFVGSAGQWLRSDKYEYLWTWLKDADEVLVTNIVKIMSPTAQALKRKGSRKIRECVRRCFMSELRQLPNLQKIVILGDITFKYFKGLSFIEVSEFDQKKDDIRVFKLRHPSYCWTVHDLEGALKKGLSSPELVIPKGLPARSIDGT